MSEFLDLISNLDITEIKISGYDGYTYRRDYKINDVCVLEFKRMIDEAMPKKKIKRKITRGLHGQAKCVYHCPNCGKQWNNMEIKKIKYCYHCGQAIDGSNEDE